MNTPEANIWTILITPEKCEKDFNGVLNGKRQTLAQDLCIRTKIAWEVLS